MLIAPVLCAALRRKAESRAVVRSLAGGRIFGSVRQVDVRPEAPPRRPAWPGVEQAVGNRRQICLSQTGLPAHRENPKKQGFSMPFPRASQALSHFTVLDLTRVRSGPTC